MTNIWSAQNPNTRQNKQHLLKFYLITKLSIFRDTYRVKAEVPALDHPMLGPLRPRNTLAFSTFDVRTQRFTLTVSRVATLANVRRSGNFVFANLSVFCLCFCLFVFLFFDFLSFFIASPRHASRRV